MRKVVCVIDDDEIYQKIIQKLILRAEVFDVSVFFRSAKDALHEFLRRNTHLPSVILLDINMPVMDGWQFLELLEASFPSLFDKTKVFIVSSSIAYSDKEKLKMYSKVSGFLSKPVGVEEIKKIGVSIR